MLITRVDGSIGTFPSFQAASKYVLKDMPTNTCRIVTKL